MDKKLKKDVAKIILSGVALTLLVASAGVLRIAFA